jgi:8-oxo-dGTP pyrophosphatase MutT (NUDIX family)
MTAIRETFEETGLLMAKSREGAYPAETVLDQARKAVHSQQLSFNEFLSKYELDADTSGLLPFSQWITPVTSPK